jgi:hypothetical protein
MEYIDEAYDVMSLEKTANNSALDTVAVMIERLLLCLPALLSSVRINSGMQDC